MDYPSSLIGKILQLADDEPHHLTTADMPVYTANIYCYTNSVRYGPKGNQRAVMNPGEVIWMDKANLRDFMFKNHTAGDNGLVVAVATVPNAFVTKNLRL